MTGRRQMGAGAAGSGFEGVTGEDRTTPCTEDIYRN